MPFVHFERINPLTKKPFPLDSPNAHVYVNPAAVAKVQGHTQDMSLIFYADADIDVDVVLGFAADVVTRLEDEDCPVVNALNEIDNSLDKILTAIEGIDCGR